MYKNCNVVMLSTNEKASNIVKILKDTISYTTTENISGGTYQHLYITSDEKIKEDNWCFNSYDNKIWKYKPSPCPLPYWGNKDTLTKIIASTDTSLGLPQPSQQFIQQYIEEYNKGNIITDVLVELKSEESYGCDLAYYGLTEPEIEVNQDNTINIKPIKNSWSREEIITLFRHFRTDMLPLGQVVDFELNSWIEENL